MSADFHFKGRLEELDPAIHDLIAREAKRQQETIILIASESESADVVHEAIANPFAHIYAEGYPREASRQQTEAEILDIDYELAHYRRFSDPRYYKGVEYADILEALTRRRAAELFAANSKTADQLYVNVQTLSGGPANTAVYTALLNPGDTLMGLKLADGGHLSHGASFNRSGAAYNGVHFMVDPQLGALNYDEIEAMALETKPRIIVAGFSAYPLKIDWQRFRQIADKVGAYLHADISHISGLVAAGVHPSPIGIADVVMTTTHKSLCGPRGAMILTHRRDLARKIDRAVFPGEQGGPHLNTMAALAVALKLARSETFRDLQHRIARNAARLAQKLNEMGLNIPFGGSETHLLLVDCGSIKVNDVPLTGDMASRILDVAGIVVNRNNIPGDKSALNPFGIRIGTVWISQRGFGDAEVDLLAEAIGTVLKGSTPYFYRGGKSRSLRAKVTPEALDRGREIVRQLTGTQPNPVDDNQKAVSVRGSAAGRFLDQALTSSVLALDIGQAQASHIFGHNIDTDVVVERADEEMFRVHTADGKTAVSLQQWLSDLSDAYVDFGDLHAKLAGPVVVTLATADKPTMTDTSEAINKHKPFFVGQEHVSQGEPLPAFEWEAAPEQPIKQTPLYETHQQLGAKMVPFGGYDMPVWYSSVSEEHTAVRQTAGLFDVSHMGVFDVAGKGADHFLDQVLSNDLYLLEVGQSQYTYLLDPSGRVIDDLLVYRLAQDRFMLVVNASNNDEDWAWLNKVKDGQVRISESRPWVKLEADVTLRDLRHSASGADQRVDIALQGPAATDILLALSDDAHGRRIKSLRWGDLTQAHVGGYNIIVSRTGYTGERVAYELFVHPNNLVDFWNSLLAAGEPLGLKPCGLASRDSTRTEAGLPLHGHELAGSFNINPQEAGFGKFMKLHKPFFIGRDAMIDAILNYTRKIVRFRMDEKGVRRPETGDPVIDKRGRVVGHVTSCAIDQDGVLLGQALVPLELGKVGTPLNIYQTGGGERPLKEAAQFNLGARLPIPNTATVLSRFP